MEITTDQIKELREATGVSVMQCKKALEEAEGDFEKAKLILRKISAKAASKKADRELGAGIVGSYVHAGGAVAALVELQCETDFVAKNEDFMTLARDIAMHVTAAVPAYLTVDEVNEEEKEKARALFTEEAADKPADIQEKIIEGKLASYFKEKVLLDQAYIKNPDQTISGLLEEGTQKFGEKVEIARFVRFGVLE